MTAKRILIAAWVVYAVHVALFVGAEIAVAGRVGAPIDDGWIYMAFARALAGGEGLTYPGYDGSLCAVTGPIWSAILAIGIWVAGPTIVVAKTCGVLTGACGIYATYRLGVAATRRAGTAAEGDRRLAAVAALLLAATPRFVWGSLSIMEVPFYVATVAWGMALHLERRAGPLGRWVPALVVLWLAGWARPECFVFPMLAALHRREVRSLAICGGLLALYPAYHWIGYGHPLPTTFYAKAAGAAPWSVFARDGIGAAVTAVALNPLHQLVSFVSYLPTYLPLLAIGVVPGVVRSIRERDSVRFVALALIAFIFARGLLGVSQPAFQYGRYYAHAWVLFAIVALHGFDRARVATWPAVLVLGAVGVLTAVFPHATLIYAFDWVSEGVAITNAQGWAIFWVSSAIGGALIVAGAIARRPARPPVWAVVVYLAVAAILGAVRNGRNVRDTYEMNVAMALRVREVVPADAVVACHDIGALGFFAERRLLDLAGLGSPEVVFGPRRPDGSIDGQAVLIERRPTWLCLTEGMFDAVMGGRQALPTLRGVPFHETIEFPPNITLLGSRYHLIKLEWE